MTDLAAGQVWRPSNGEPKRMVLGVDDADARDMRIMVYWSAVRRERRIWGDCTEKAFRRWIKRTGAKL